MFIYVMQGFLGVLFSILGLLTLAKNSFAMKNYQNLNLPTWFTYVIGIFQLMGGLLILIGFWVEELALVSSAILTLMMIVSSFLHVKYKDTMVGVLPALVVGIIAAATFISYV